LSRFTKWRQYYHHVLAVIDGIKVPVPFNLNSLSALFPPKYAKKLEKKLIERFGYGGRIPILKLKQSLEKDIRFLAQYIYKNIYYGYTKKQWGLTPEDLAPSVTARVPIIISHDNRYFQDTCQGIPSEGYTKMFAKMIDHPNIQIALQTDHKQVRGKMKESKWIFTGQIDSFFDYLYGQLSYRSLEFKYELHGKANFQEVAQVNYPNDNVYTRITEFKHLTGQKINDTVIAYEFPHDYLKGENEPYYPILTEKNKKIFRKYKKKAEKIKDKVMFLGRLADYKYYNMDQVVAKALRYFHEKIALKSL
jgi:UDP-galactopyranose mutase